MNDMQHPPAQQAAVRLPEGPDNRESPRPASAPAPHPARGTGGRGLLLGLGALLLLVAALGVGFSHHSQLNAQVAAAAEQRRDFVPRVRTATVNASSKIMTISWPGTTKAFEQANVYARASGYISRRDVDIGSPVKAGQLLIEITAPELDHQIAQAGANLAQLRASLQQAKANRDLAQVTWDRDNPLVQKGWVTPQQGDTDRLNLQARTAAVAIADSNIAAQEAELRVLNQQKVYQSVAAPFDGVITQRNVDIGALVQADATSGTFLFTLMRSDTIRIQLHVPQVEAFGLAPGVEAVVRVPEMPGRNFPGTVTRIADALDPGTRTLLTEIDVPNPDHALAPGVYCIVELHIPRKTPSLVVPSEAIIFNRSGLSVAVVDGGFARIHSIDETRDFGTSVEVTAGVSQGDRVILNPPVDLVDGGKVEVRAESQGAS
jgi:RND family efflux transporter MFP subunit